MPFAMPASLLLITKFQSPLSTATALKCYACSSLQEPNCWNVTLLSERHTTSCEDLYYACTTRVTTMEGLSFIGRNCLPKGICENTINEAGKIEDRCVTCATDFCNTSASGGASTQRPAAAAASVSRVLGAVLVLFTVKWR